MVLLEEWVRSKFNFLKQSHKPESQKVEVTTSTYFQGGNGILPVDDPKNLRPHLNSKFLIAKCVLERSSLFNSSFFFKI